MPIAATRLASNGRMPATNRLDLAIGLPLRNAATLDQFLQQLYDPASTNFHRYLKPEEFTRQFGPTAADYQAVADFVRSNGLSVTHTHGNRVLLDVNGKVSDIEKAFNITLKTFRHPSEARNFFAPDAEPSVDAQLPVVDVSGLSDYARLRPRFSRLENPAGTLTPQSGSGASGSYFGNDFRNAYTPGTSLTGAGQMIGLVQFDGYYTNDIVTYATLAGGGRTNILVQRFLLDGFNGTPADPSANVEVSLDIEMAMAMAPGLAKIMVFEAPNNTAFFNDVLNAMAANYQIKNLSCSWGGGNANATAETIFKQMAAQGQSFFNATGDSDAFTGQVPFPSDSPSITEVGGTTLTMNGVGVSYASETAWNRGFDALNNEYVGSSGGISTTYSIPVWQQSVNMSTNGGSITMRNTPDVALVAENVRVYYGNGTNDSFGGTSCAAPLWAGFMALVNQQAASAGHAPVGFANPAIYAIGQGTNYTSCFNDTTVGNNFWASSPTNFPATAGYDLCTGWGTPTGTNLINALVGLADTFEISPAGGLAFGSTNGLPFDFATHNFLLTNSGSSSLGWRMTGTPAWLTIQPTNGLLAAGGQANVTVSLNSVSSNLFFGSYHADLLFSNLTSAVGQLRPLDLVMFTPSIVQNGGFETGDLAGWTLTGNGIIGATVYNAVVNAGSFGDTSGTNFIHSGIYGMFMGDNQIAVLTQNLNTLPGQRYLLSFWLDNPVGGSGEQFLVDWNTNSSASNQIFGITNPPAISWTNITFAVTATSTNTTLQFRAANLPDGFGLDDIIVTPVPVPVFSSLSRNANSFTMTWNSLGGIGYQAQYKTNLLQPNWISLGNFTTSNYSLTLTDTNALVNTPQRFYRLVVP